jgi:hypothetical protein
MVTTPQTSRLQEPQGESPDMERRPPASDPDVPPTAGPPWASGWRGLGASVVVNWVAPLIVYRLVRTDVGSDAVALIVSAAIPLAWTLGRLVMQRRVDPIGLLWVAAFGLGILALVLTHGNSFAFKIREPALTGALGLACLASLVIGRPLVLPLLRRRVEPFGSPASPHARPLPGSPASPESG